MDLFAGCGGMSLGFQRAGCEIVAGLELDPIRAQTHARNFHRHLGQRAEELHGRSRDVTQLAPQDCLREVTGALFTDIDVLVGGPPCQAYARVGRAKLREIAQHPEAYLHDARGQLYAAYLAHVEALEPAVVVMENVPDILSYGGVNVAQLVAENLEELGYTCRYTLLNAANYGVPQTRERWYLIALHREVGGTPRFPDPTHFVDLPPGYRGTRSHALAWASDCPANAVPLKQAAADLTPATTCEEALSDLPIVSEETKAALKRGARDLTLRLPYRHRAKSPFQHQMRSWPGFESSADVSAHVIRSLPRDYEIFRHMREGDDYPAAYRVAEARFHAKPGRLHQTA
jgi:DNA (cytosine-5)-methyltransferase 1